MWNKNEMSQLDAMLTRVPLNLTLGLDLWPWIFKVKLYLGNAWLDCHGTKGTGVDSMPWYETLRKWVNLMLCWLGYLWPWTCKVKLFLGNGRTDCHCTKGTEVFRTPWCETLRKWVNWTLRWLGYIWPWPLTLTVDLDFSRSNCISGVGGPNVMERKGRESIPWLNVKHNHYVTLRRMILLRTGVT